MYNVCRPCRTDPTREPSGLTQVNEGRVKRHPRSARCPWIHRRRERSVSDLFSVWRSRRIRCWEFRKAKLLYFLPPNGSGESYSFFEGSMIAPKFMFSFVQTIFFPTHFFALSLCLPVSAQIGALLVVLLSGMSVLRAFDHLFEGGTIRGILFFPPTYLLQPQFNSWIILPKISAQRFSQFNQSRSYCVGRVPTSKPRWIPARTPRVSRPCPLRSFLPPIRTRSCPGVEDRWVSQHRV